ncbi:MAG: hypothetical protein IPH50_04370 [Rhodanobacteraceae bacterium]|nr:hypothetical protein [Rhodanobacteraceae bacterium]
MINDAINGIAKRDRETTEHAALVARVTDAKAARQKAYQAARPDIERQVRNATTAGDSAAIVEALQPWEIMLGPEDVAKLRAAKPAADAENARAKAEQEKALEYRQMLEDESEEFARIAKAERESKLGPKPVQSAWDGSYSEIDRYLKRMAHDPDSIEFVGCSAPLVTDGGWNIRCEYRGKNAFGALVRNDQWFLVRQSKVVSVK